ncbi:MAG: protein kinase [Planctomycetota bacterium]|nr:protein kinase [Planctomycetota bacterium]
MDGNKPLVADFGLATGRHEQAFTGNTVSGTLAYIAPERFRPKMGNEATPRTDVFAWGVIFYRLLSGRLPFDGRNKKELIERITNDIPADDLSVEAVPPYLVAIVRKCLAKNPAERFGSFRDVIQAFRDGEFDEHRPWFIPETERVLDTSRRSVFISDLKYRKRWLEYVANADAERQLDAFCNDPRPFLWWGVVGPGGVGKSRLAHELVRRLTRDEVWDAGFLRDDVAHDFLADVSKNWRPHEPTLIVIDYSTRCADALLTCLYTLSDPQWQQALGDGARVRLLVLDRPGSAIAPASFEKLTESKQGNYDAEDRPNAPVRRGRFRRRSDDRRPKVAHRAG